MKIPSETQLKALASKVNNPLKGVLTVTTEDPGEGSALADGHLIAVVEA